MRFLLRKVIDFHKRMNNYQRTVVYLSVVVVMLYFGISIYEIGSMLFKILMASI